MDPRFTQKTARLGGGEICRVDGNIYSLEDQEVPADQTTRERKYLSLHIEVPESREGPGLVGPVT